MLIDVVGHQISLGPMQFIIFFLMFFVKRRKKTDYYQKANICSQKFGCLCIDVDLIRSKPKQNLTEKTAKYLYH